MNSTLTTDHDFAPTCVQHHAQDAVDVDPGMPEAGVGHIRGELALARVGHHRRECCYCAILTLVQTATKRTSEFPDGLRSGCHALVSVMVSPSNSTNRTCSVPVHASFQEVSTLVM